MDGKCSLCSLPCAVVSALQFASFFASASESGLVEASDIVRKAFLKKKEKILAAAQTILSSASHGLYFYPVCKSILGTNIRFLEACSFNSDHCKLSYASV